jgi:hypothetical protein
MHVTDVCVARIKLLLLVARARISPSPVNVSPT